MHARLIARGALSVAMAPALLVAAPAHAQTSSRTATIPTTVEFPEGSWAITVCVTRPLTWYNDEMPDSVRAMVEVHEAAHREFMSTFLSCWDYRNWLREGSGRIVEAEARAFCAGARHDYSAGRHRTLEAALAAHERLFSTQFGLTLEAARAAMRAYCPAIGP